jgi:hypothetical protein
MLQAKFTPSGLRENNDKDFRSVPRTPFLTGNLRLVRSRVSKLAVISDDLLHFTVGLAVSLFNQY